MNERECSSGDFQHPSDELKSLMIDHKNDLILGLRTFDLLTGNDSFKDIITVIEEQAILALDRDGQYHEAAEKFLTAFLDSKETTKWSVLKEALNRPDHGLVRFILYESTPADFQERDQAFQVLKLFRSHVINKVDSVELRNQLLQNELITQSDFEQISAIHREHGDSRSLHTTLSMLPKTKGWYREFLKTLIEIQQDELVKWIDPDMFEKLKNQYDSGYNEETCSVMFVAGEAASNPESKLLADCNNSNEFMHNDNKSSPDKLLNVPIMNNQVSNDFNEGPVSSRTRSKTAMALDGNEEKKNVRIPENNIQPPGKYQKPQASYDSKQIISPNNSFNEGDVELSGPPEEHTTKGPLGFQSPQTLSRTLPVSKDGTKTGHIGFQSHIVHSPPPLVKPPAVTGGKKLTKSKSEHSSFPGDQDPHITKKHTEKLQRASTLPEESKISNTSNRSEIFRGEHCKKSIPSQNRQRHFDECRANNSEVKQGHRDSNSDSDRRQPEVGVVEERSGGKNHLRLFLCPDCQKKFLSEANLISHQQNSCGREHTKSETLHQTTYVEKTRPVVKSSRSMFPNATMPHQNESYPCQHCQKTFDTERCLSIHNAKVHPPNKNELRGPMVSNDIKPHQNELYHCQQCQNSFTTERGLNIHTTKVHSQTKREVRAPVVSNAAISNQKESYHCQQCQKSFTTEKGLNIHITKVHSQNTSEARAPVVSNAAMPHQNESYPCQQCQNSFTTERGLNIHTTKVHSQTKREVGLRAPVVSNDAISNQNESYHCQQCQKSFTTEKGLNIHITKVHSQNTSEARAPVVSNAAMPHQNESYPCQQCQKSFTTERGLNIHITKVHSQNTSEARAPVVSNAAMPHQNESYPCQQCQKSFTTEKGLNIHITKVHSQNTSEARAPVVSNAAMPHQNESYPCQQCQKSFTTEKGLNIHITKVHSQNTSEARAPVVSNAAMPHQNESYPCQQCQKSFTTEKGLNIHRTKVHPPNICKTCGKHFETTAGLKIHMTKMNHR